MNENKLTPGSYSSATLLPRDILEKLVDHIPEDEPLYSQITKHLNAISHIRYLNDKQTERATLLLDEAIDFLDNLCPPHHYFGGHCGDPADIGCWPNESWAMPTIYIYANKDDPLPSDKLKPTLDPDDELDRLSQITEAVILWASNNGYSYDNIYWEEDN